MAIVAILEIFTSEMNMTLTMAFRIDKGQVNMPIDNPYATSYVMVKPNLLPFEIFTIKMPLNLRTGRGQM